ncbi:hypothetical protein [Halomonas casei]|uniref:hypothetical protein n=1 Tax=Halomonas casei TaxID=2742613 RepID=UPI003CEEAC7F
MVIDPLNYDEITFARLLGFYQRVTEGPDAECPHDRSPEWIASYNEGHEEADDIDTHNWDAAYAQGKGDVLLNAGLAQGKEVPKQ